MKSIRLVLTCATACFALHLAASVSANEWRKGAEAIGLAAAQDLLKRSEFVFNRSDHFNGIHYAEAAAGYGALRFLHALSRKDLAEAISRRLDKAPGSQNLAEVNHVDASVWGALLLQRAISGGSNADRAAGLSLANAQWVPPLPNGLTRQARFWIDDIWMIGILQIQAYRATKDPLYLDRAARTAVAYVEKLQQPNGLFHHGPNAPHFWGRGNGWVASGLAEIIGELPQDHPARPALVKAFVKMIDTLISHQADSGLWRQVIDHPTAWKETSATAMFGFAIAVGVECGLLKGEKYREAYRRAWKGLSMKVDGNGILRDICVGTGKSRDVAYYLERPAIAGDLHGQAPLLWFAERLLAVEKE